MAKKQKAAGNSKSRKRFILSKKRFAWLLALAVIFICVLLNRSPEIREVSENFLIDCRLARTEKRRQDLVNDYIEKLFIPLVVISIVIVVVFGKLVIISSEGFHTIIIMWR